MVLILKLSIIVANTIFLVLNTAHKTKEKSAANFEFHYANAHKKIFFYLKINK